MQTPCASGGDEYFFLSPELSEQTAVPHGYPPPAAAAERPGDTLRGGRPSHEEPAGGAAELCEQGGPRDAPRWVPRSAPRARGVLSLPLSPMAALIPGPSPASPSVWGWVVGRHLPVSSPIIGGFPGDTSGKEPACQCSKCKRLGFDL